ncbi:MAG: exodeoxyribonuclease VII large subunit [Fervidobacterium sp.]|nr:exodeoxyribonuclease VII large subunit [Fervidobacterium sp.]
MESIPFKYNDSQIIEFSTLRDFMEYVESRLKETDFMKTRYKFSADVVKVKPYNGSLYITVSQETTDGKKTELTVIIWKNLTRTILDTLGLKSPDELEHKKWEFQGRLSFYSDRAQLSFWADSVLPQGESDILKRRQKIKQLLKKEGLLTEVLHELTELEPIKCIAVISSKTAQGYFDFLSNLLVPDTMRPVVHLYESSMQGATTAEEVISALNRIELFCRESMIKYDVIVIIRGGGGPSDLMYFDDYNLARRIAYMNEFIPVLTGIGHEKDETIPDFVAWRRFPTPTAVAKEISNQLKGYLNLTETNYREIRQLILNRIEVVATRIGRDTKTVLEDIFNKNLAKMYKELAKDSETIYNLFSISEYEKLLSKNFLESLSNNIDFHIEKINKTFKQDSELLSRTIQMEIQLQKQRIDNLQSLSEILEKTYVSTMSVIETQREDLMKIGGPFSAFLFGGAVVTKDGTIVQGKKHLSQNDLVILNFLDGSVGARIEKINRD